MNASVSINFCILTAGCRKLPHGARDGVSRACHLIGLFTQSLYSSSRDNAYWQVAGKSNYVQEIKLEVCHRNV